MKVAISATGDRLESEMDPRFGRCPYFIVVDTKDMNFTAFANTNAELSNGAGIQAAGFLADQGVQTVLTGNCGPKAVQAFETAGINVYTGYAGSVKDALESFKQQGGSDQPATAQPGRPSENCNSQMNGAAGGGQGMGGGCGRGMGGGGGRGMGGGGRGQCGNTGRLKKRSQTIKAENGPC